MISNCQASRSEMPLTLTARSNMIVPYNRSTQSKVKRSLHDCFQRTDDYGACLASVDEIRKILVEYPGSVRELGPDEIDGLNPSVIQL